MVRRYFLIGSWVCLSGGLIFFVVLPYLFHNQLYQWDTPGHLTSAWYIREYLWPWPTGWNPFFFAGFPQGTFYPPLFHYLSALGSFIMPLSISFKILVALGIVCTPWAMYRWCRALGLNSVQATISAIAVVTLLASPIDLSHANNAIGGTFYSTFNVGLVTNAFALPLFLFYVGSLHRFDTTRRLIVSSLLLSAIVLTHTYTVIAAVVYAIMFIIIHRSQWRKFVWHIALALLLTAWWWVPFLVHINYAGSANISVQLGFAGFVILVAGFGLVLWLWSREKLRVVETPALFFVVITVGILFLNTVALPVHAYRLVLFPLLMVIPLLVVIMNNQRKQLILGATMLILCSGMVWYGIQSGNGFDPRGPQVDQLANLKTDLPPRTLVLSEPAEQQEPHLNQFLPVLRTRQALMKGLFVESSQTARYSLSFEKMLDPNSFVWGSPILFGEMLTDEEKKSLATNLFNYFGIQTLLSAKTPRAVSYISSQPGFGYNLPWPHWSIEIQKDQLLVSQWREPIYLTKNQGRGILVDQRREPTVFTIIPIEKLSERTILRLPDETHYLRQLYPDLYQVEFSLPNSLVHDDSRDVLAELRSAIDALPQKSLEREELHQKLVQVEATLLRRDTEQAQAAYADAPIILVDIPVTATYRIDQLRTIDAVRSIKLQEYNLAQTSLVEILGYKPETVASSQWQKTVDAWMFGRNTDKILARNDQPITTPGDNGEIQELHTSSREDHISFKVQSDDLVPIYIKMSYFPKWKALMDGKPIPIYQASPNMMIIYGRGDIVLRYANTWWETLVSGLSALVFVYAIIIFFLRRNQFLICQSV